MDPDDATRHRQQPPTALSVPAHIEYTSKPTTDAQVVLVRRSRGERMRRATLGWAACWGLGIAAVFVPVLHFVLVPALLLAGPLVASFRWREQATVLSVRGTCPGCEHPVTVAMKQPARASMAWRCPDCGRPLTLRVDPVLFESAA
jgi:hypothetical protein